MGLDDQNPVVELVNSERDLIFRFVRLATSRA